MELSSSYTFIGPPERVWALLMDPGVLASCVPGCKGFEPDGDDRYKVTVTVGLAAITGTYAGSVAVSDKAEPSSYKLTVDGQGRAGFVNGTAAITLTAEGEATTVSVAATVHPGGAIARLGQRLIGAAAKLMMDQFFSCLQSKLSSGDRNP